MKEEGFFSKKKLKVLGFLLVFGFVFRLVVIFGVLEPASYLKWMPKEIHERALLVMQGKSRYLANAWGSFYLFLGGEYKIFSLLGLDFLSSAVFLNVVFLSIANAFFYLLAREVVSKSVALVSSLLLMVYFPGLYLGAMLVGESLFLMFLMMGVYWLTKRERMSNWFLAGLWFGFAVCVRMILAGFIPLVMLWIVLTEKSVWMKKLGSSLLLGLGVLLPMVLVGVLNKRFSSQGMFQLSGSGGVNFTMTQCRYKKVRYETDSGESFWFSPPFFHGSKYPIVEEKVPFYRQGYYYRKGWECLRDNPVRWLENTENIKNVFKSSFYPKIGDFKYLDELIDGWSWVVIGFFGLFLIFPVFCKEDDLEVYMLGLFLIISLFVAVYFLNPGEERYIVPYVWVIFLYGLESLRLIGRKIWAWMGKGRSN